jgi:hypothetical protein
LLASISVLLYQRIDLQDSFYVALCDIEKLGFGKIGRSFTSILSSNAFSGSRETRMSSRCVARAAMGMAQGGSGSHTARQLRNIKRTTDFFQYLVLFSSSTVSISMALLLEDRLRTAWKIF